jgi:hypothetical protein
MIVHTHGNEAPPVFLANRPERVYELHVSMNGGNSFDALIPQGFKVHPECNRNAYWEAERVHHEIHLIAETDETLEPQLFIVIEDGEAVGYGFYGEELGSRDRALVDSMVAELFASLDKPRMVRIGLGLETFTPEQLDTLRQRSGAPAVWTKVA